MRGTVAFGQRPIASGYIMWDNVEKGIAEIARQCLHFGDSKAGNVMPRLLGDLFHSTGVGDVLHADYFNLAESQAIDMGGLFDGSYKHMLALMDDVRRFVWLEKDVSSSMEMAARVVLKWCASVGGAQGVHQLWWDYFYWASDVDGAVTKG